MAVTAPKQTRYPALQHRNFVLIWSGLLISNMGTWMQNVAQSWLIYQLTGNDPLYLGWLGLSFAIPMVIMPPLGGALADRINRVKLLYVTQTCSLLLALLLAVLTWTDLIQPIHILITSFVGALLLAFDNPTRQALIPELVPREDLLNAVSLNSATYTGAALVGPAIAGVLLDTIGAGWLFLINSVSFLAVIGALYSMRDAPNQSRRSVPLREAIFGGVVYAWRHTLIAALLLLSALAAIFGRSYQQLLPVFADDIWRVGSGGYGWLLAAGGGGALMGAFTMASIKEIKRQGRVLVISGLLFCAALAAFALSPIFALGVVLLVLVGFLSTVFTTNIATVIQLRVPNELRGRVMSLYAITLIGLPSLGALGLASVARALATDQIGWVHALLRALDLLRITTFTERLGAVAGAPRAIVVGALVLAAVLVVTLPLLLRIRSHAERA